jgi:putative copper resistance protein D
VGRGRRFPIPPLHLTADALHFMAASAWFGGLVPLALLLATARRSRSFGCAFLARDAAQRFSTLGVISVGTLLVSGIVNAWVLVGSLHALIVTPYGHLLVLKIAVFAIMLVFAGVNRFWLVPKLTLSLESDTHFDVLRQLTRNSVVETILGFTIFAIVGLLGTLHPAIHGV